MSEPMEKDEPKKVTFLMPKDLWRRLRMAAVREDTSVTRLVNAWIEEKVKELEDKAERQR